MTCNSSLPALSHCSVCVRHQAEGAHHFRIAQCQEVVENFTPTIYDSTVVADVEELARKIKEMAPKNPARDAFGLLCKAPAVPLSRVTPYPFIKPFCKLQSDQI